MDLARAPRRARLTARKKGSGYENVLSYEYSCVITSYVFTVNNSVKKCNPLQT